MMEVEQMVIVTIMVGLTGTIAYFVGDLHGFLRGMERARKIYDEKRI